VKPQEVKGEELDTERGEALSDMISVDERADEVIFDRLHETAYRGTPLARPVLGSVNSVKSLTEKDVTDYVNTHFTGSRIVVSASGAVDHKAVVEAAKAAFGSIPAKSDAAYLVPALFTGSEIRIRDDYLPRAHGAIAFPTAGHADADQIPLLVAQQLIGTWNKSQWVGTNSTSDLIKQVAREHLADSIKTFNINYR
jgi:processing peptidase subunit beta